MIASIVDASTCKLCFTTDFYREAAIHNAQQCTTCFEVADIFAFGNGLGVPSKKVQSREYWNRWVFFGGGSLQMITADYIESGGGRVWKKQTKLIT